MRCSECGARAAVNRWATVWFALSYGGAIVGYLAVFAFAARLLGDTFGYFVIAVTVSTLLGQLGLFGVHRGGLREAARLHPDDEEGLRDLRRGVRAVSLVALPCMSVLTATATFFVLQAANLHARYALAAGMGVLVWLSGQQKLWANYLRGFGQVRFASLLEGRSGGALTSGFQGLFVGAVLLFFPRGNDRGTRCTGTWVRHTGDAGLETGVEILAPCKCQGANSC